MGDVDPRNPLVRLPSMALARALLDDAQREALAIVLCAPEPEAMPADLWAVPA